MAIKTILVCLTTEANADELMTAACILARRHNAHLVGLHTMEALLVYPGIAMHVPGPAFAQFNSSQKAQAKAIEQVFTAHTRAEDFVSEWRLVKAESSTAGDRIVESAHAADLLVMSQENPETDRADQADIQRRLIRDSGRPVLVIPHGYKTDEIGKNVLIGWSATREATRAAHDCLNILQKGAEVHLLSIADSTAQEEQAAITQNDLAATIARHDAGVNVVHRARGGSDITDILMQEAFERGADMAVTGAFGHSRFYDFVIGAATRELLQKMKIPVLFSK